MPNLPHAELTGTIIGAYFEVYNNLSHTYPEYIYEKALREELRRRDIQTTRQDKYDIVYKDKYVGRQELDLFVAQEVVVEIKAVERLTKLHKAQTISYLKTVDKPVGLLFNFGHREVDFNRLYFNPAKKPSTSPLSKPPVQPDESWLYPELLYQIVGGLYEVHSTLGAGFVHRIYANACKHELAWRDLASEPHQRMQVIYKDVVIGDIAFGHIIIAGKVMLFPVAIGNIQDIRSSNLRAWMQWCDIRLGIIANFDAVRLELVYLRT